MPQWDFLNFLTEQARKYPRFSLRMSTPAIDVIHEGDRVAGVRAEGPDGRIEIRADLIVAADGRTSTLRAALGIAPVELGAPMDVLWFRFDRTPTDPATALGYIGAGYMFITINRSDYWQCGFIIPKGSLDRIKAEGLDALRAKIVAVQPAFASRVHEITSWDDVKLLSVAVNRLRQWYRDGILFIGDAAHAMSPIGGVGINLAIQDAIAASRILAPAFDRPGPVGNDVLARVQRRREYPAKMTQFLQVTIQNRLVRAVLASQKAPERAPGFLHLMNRFPFLQRIPARLVGIGFRAEHLGD
jgi:2-polyprenyl-6-methoxyphenol hydroxylase-like FAD-dependent oxidoreductase